MNPPVSGKPDAGVTKARKLVLQDKVQMFVGGLLASTGYALAPVSSKDAIYYVTLIFLWLFLTARSMESLRWRS